MIHWTAKRGIGGKKPPGEVFGWRPSAVGAADPACFLGEKPCGIWKKGLWGKLAIGGEKIGEGCTEIGGHLCRHRKTPHGRDGQRSSCRRTWPRAVARRGGGTVWARENVKTGGKRIKKSGQERIRTAKETERFRCAAAWCAPRPTGAKSGHSGRGRPGTGTPVRRPAAEWLRFWYHARDGAGAGCGPRSGRRRRAAK